MKRLLALLTLVLTLATIAAGQVSAPNFNGKWTFKSGKNPSDIALLEVSQSQSAFEVTETYKSKTKKPARVLTYYSDGRGESNPTSDGQSEIRSRTKWEGDRLSTLFESFARQPDTVNERRDEWMLSKDGETLTIITTFAFSSPRVNANHNPLGMNNASPPKVHELTRKRVFKKVK
jgi:hypothetical protein